MHHRWKELFFCHWALEPERLRPLIPTGLDLDTYEGLAYVGLVAFTMEGMRLAGVPAVPGLSGFHETNVRTYVHRRGRDPGVWFFSLDAANSLAVRMARAWYHLPYHRSNLFLDRERPHGGNECRSILCAGVRRWPGPVPASYLIRGEVTGPVEPAKPGTLEHFLAERYLLYARQGTRLFSGAVHHRPYPLQTASVRSIDESLLAAAGIERPDSKPLAHYAAAVDVKVYKLNRL